MSEDKELQELLQKKALQTWQELRARQLREQLRPTRTVVETPEMIIRQMKEIVEGERAEEIIDKAVEYYGEQAIEVFKQILKLYRDGRIGKLRDYELYQILQQIGMRIPLETRIRIVRHGSEKSFSEVLSE